MQQRRVGIVLRRAAVLADLSALIQALCARGLHVHLLVQAPVRKDEAHLVSDLCADQPGVTLGYAAARSDRWVGFAEALGNALDVCRHFHPDFSAAPTLTKHAQGLAQAFARRCCAFGRAVGADRNPKAAAALIGFLRGLTRALPADPDVVAYLRQLDLDALLLTDLTGWDSSQADFVTAAAKAGVPSALLVESWEGLTALGDIKRAPDRLLAWNAAQAEWAVRLHGVDPASVRVVGAFTFDDALEGQTAAAGDLDGNPAASDHRPVLLYADAPSQPGFGAVEAQQFMTWLRALRASEAPGLSDARVILRTHPTNFDIWKGFSSGDAEVTVLAPRGHRVPTAEDLNADRQILRRAAAMVGGDSRMILEAGLAGAPVFAAPVLAEAPVADRTPAHLGLAAPGHVVQLTDPEGHFTALADALALDRDGARAPNPEAVALVRPGDATTPALTTTIAAIEALCDRTDWRMAPSAAAWRPVLFASRAALAWAAWLAAGRERARERRQTKSLGPGHSREEQQRYRTTRDALERLQALAKQDWSDQPLAQNAMRRQMRPRHLDRLVDVETILGQTAEGDAPILFGPWLLETPHELMYWLPFLRWYRKQFKIEKARIFVISQGGVSPWYQSILGRYIDLFDVYSKSEFRDLNLFHRDPQKQAGGSTALERAIHGDVAERLGITRYQSLPAAIVYRLIEDSPDEIGDLSYLDWYTNHEPLRIRPQRIAEVKRTNPDPYVVAQFRFNDLFPDTEANRKVAARMVERLSKTVDVVTVADSFVAHRVNDLDLGAKVRVLRYKDLARWREMQTAVVGGAEAFVGTFDDLASLAVSAGKTAYCLSSGDSAELHRLRITAGRLGTSGGRLVLIDAEDADAFAPQGWRKAASIPAPPKG